MSKKNQIHPLRDLSVIFAFCVGLIIGGCSSSKAIPTSGSSDVSYRLPAIHKHTHEQLLSKKKQLYEEGKQ